MANDTLYGVHMLFSGGRSSLGDGYSAASLRNYIDEAVRLGVDVIRYPGDWNALEPSRGQWNTNYINNTRAAIQYAESKGIKVVMLFAQTPEWARPNGTGVWHPPTNTNNFANAAAYFYNQLLSVEDNIVAWEIWNEPNVFEFWGTATRDYYSGVTSGYENRIVDGEPAYVLLQTRFANEYVQLLNPAYAALHAAANAASRDMTVLGGSVNTDYQYVQAMLDAGAQFDGLAVHPYTRVNDNTPGTPDYGTPWAPDTPLATLNSSARPTLNKLWSFEYGINVLRSMVDQDIWITEFGWTIGNGWGDISESQRVQYMQTALELVKNWDDVRAAIAYRLFDDGAGAFGLLNSNGTLRDSGQVLKDYALMLGVGNTYTGTAGNDVLVGTAGNDEFYALGGNDTLDGRGGDDFYLGGAGSDRFIYTDGQDFIGDFEVANDKLVLTSFGFSSFAEVQARLQQWGPNAALVIDSDRYIALESVDRQSLTAANFELSQAQIRGTAGNDTLTGTNQSEFIFGFGGDDMLRGRGGNDSINGGPGNDIIYGDNGNDKLLASAGQDRVFGGAGNDLLGGLSGVNILTGGTGSDVYIVDADDVVIEQANQGY